MVVNASGRRGLDKKRLCDAREGQQGIVDHDLGCGQIRLISMDQKGRNLHVSSSLGYFIVSHEGQGTGVGLAEAGQRRDLRLEVTVNGAANDFVDLGERKWGRELRLAHRVAPFFLVFEATDDVALGFFEEAGFDFGGEGFFEADRDSGAFFEAGFFDVALEGVAGLSDSDLAFDGCAASCRWT